MMEEAITAMSLGPSNAPQYQHRLEGFLRREGTSQGSWRLPGLGQANVLRPTRPDLENLKRWLPRGVVPESSKPDPSPAKAAEKGIALTELLDRVKGVINEGFPNAEWVRAEISELRGKNGHLYHTLTERNDQGDILAQAKGIIWRNRAQ